MNLEDEKFRFKFNQMKKGANYYFFQILDDSLFLVVDELSKFENVTDEMIYTCLYALINSIKIYNYEKSSGYSKFVSDYIHLTLLIARENKIMPNQIYEIMLPNNDVILEEEYVEECFNKIKDELKSVPKKEFLYK